MTVLTSNIDRRSFLQGAVATAFGTMSCGLSFPLLADEQWLLPLRQGAAPLALHFNENSLGMSPQAVMAAQKAIQVAGNRYPDGAVEALRNRLADKHGVESGQVVMGNGSTQVIQALVSVMALQQAKVLEPTPTFGDVRRYAKAEGLELVQVPVGSDFVTDIKAMKAKASTLTGPLLINICNPNNPTGTIADSQRLLEWIRTAPKNHMFLVDEAYFDYAQRDKHYASALTLVKDGIDNLLVTRTFSKLYGMAGMRLGYGLGSATTIAKVAGFANDFNLSAGGVAAAMASLQDEAFFASSLASNAEAKGILLSTLDQLGLKHIPSHTNFVLHRIGVPLADYAAKMKANGIKVGRRMTQEDGWNRLSIGTPDEMRSFSQTLLAFRQKGWV